jgi:hypothetical protein
VLILLGDVLSTAYQQAQLQQGIFSPDTISVGDLFAGALFPGLMLVGMYLVYLIAVAMIRPVGHARPAGAREGETSGASLWRHLAEALLPPVALIVAVLGSILGGIATPTEAASVGAIGAILLAGHHFMPGRPLPILIGAVSLAALLVVTSFHDLRLQRTIVSSAEWAWIGLAALLTAGDRLGHRVALWRGFRAGLLQQVIHSTGQLTAMVFLILIGAALFTVVFRGLGGDDTVRALLEGVPGGTFGAMLVVMAAMFMLGFFLDFIEITLVVVPIVAPALMLMGLDPVWIGVMMAVNLQTSFLTPPFGFACSTCAPWRRRRCAPARSIAASFPSSPSSSSRLRCWRVFPASPPGCRGSRSDERRPGFLFLRRIVHLGLCNAGSHRCGQGEIRRLGSIGLSVVLRVWRYGPQDHLDLARQG